jgi:hypothetical protein
MNSLQKMVLVDSPAVVSKTLSNGLAKQMTLGPNSPKEF